MASSSEILTLSTIKLKDKTSNVLFVTWSPVSWIKTDNIESYNVKWSYTTVNYNTTWFSGSTNTITYDPDHPELCQQHEYTIPENALQIRFTVKLIGKISDEKTEKRHYNEYGWATYKTYNVTSPLPSLPSPEVGLDFSGKLEVVYSGLPYAASISVNFHVLKRITATGKDEAKYFSVYKDATSSVNFTDNIGYVRYTCNLEENAEYKVRARYVDTINKRYGEWSSDSESVFSAPLAPDSFTEIRADSESSVYLSWEPIDTAESYRIQYTDNVEYFDVIEDLPTKDTGLTNTIIQDLNPGIKWYFRICALRKDSTSKWSPISSVTLGTNPTRPTTWSASTTVVDGEPLVLCWIHNSEDGSKQTEAQIELTVGGIIEPLITVHNSETGDMDNINTYSFTETKGLTDTEILWKVRTKGAFNSVCTECDGDGYVGTGSNMTECTRCDGGPNGYGKWSIQRSATVYATPDITIALLDGQGNDTERVKGLPLRVRVAPVSTTQRPISYHISIVANEAHESNDLVGNPKMIYAGEEIFSRHYDISTALSVDLSAGDINLENNIDYTLTCSVVMNSGLTATKTKTFTTAWEGIDCWVGAEINVDMDSYVSTILPYCRDASGELIENHTLAVYRRNYDGSLTEIMSGVTNDGVTHITDPHPALDYARYRIVATSNETGSVTYNDLPGTRVGCKTIVLQWGESWSSFDTPDGVDQVDPSWAGSILKLPYNIDIRENVSPDISRVEYIGRRYPVSYSGTQLGESASWSTVIDKSDKETLYTLRRLARWNGLVYVREPSGSGYWANVIVGLSQKYDDMTIPVTFDITRVDGGE